MREEVKKTCKKLLIFSATLILNYFSGVQFRDVNSLGTAGFESLGSNPIVPRLSFTSFKGTVQRDGSGRN